MSTTHARRPRRAPLAITSAYDNQLPLAEEAERALIGCLLIDPMSCAHAIRRMLPDGKDEFFYESHQLIYDAALRLVDKGLPVDGVLIKDEMVREGTFEPMGGLERLTAIASSVPSCMRFAEYAEIVHDHHLRRRGVIAANRLLQSAFDPAVDASELLTRFRSETEDLAGGETTEDEFDAADLAEEVFGRFERGEAPSYVSTGLPVLDEVVIGLTAGDLVVIGGLRSSGKSALGLNIADHAADRLEQNVLFFAIEPTAISLTTRLLAMHARVDARDIRWGRQSGSMQLQRVQEAMPVLRRRRLRFNETPGMSIDRLMSAARADSARRKTGLIVIDQLSHITHPPQTRVERHDLGIGMFTRSLKRLAKELRCPVIVMAQLNRASEADDRPPRMSDLRDSAMIEHDADVILLLHNPDKAGEFVDSFREVGSLAPYRVYNRHCYIAKNRDGLTPHDPLTLYWTPSFQKFDGDATPPSAAPHREASGYRAPEPEPDRPPSRAEVQTKNKPLF